MDYVWIWTVVDARGLRHCLPWRPQLPVTERQLCAVVAAHHHGRRRSHAGGGTAVRDARPAVSGRSRLLPPQLHARQAAILLHLAHHVRHPELSAQDVHSERDLPANHGSLPVLPPEPAALAELHQTQSVVQRLLRQSAAVRRPAGQGQLLDTSP